MHKYRCTVTAQDTLVAYETEDGNPLQPLFAVVVESPLTKQKTSVLLNKADAKLLATQLSQFAES